MNPSLRHRFFSASCFILLALPFSLSAQDVDEENTFVLDPFVVSTETEGYQARNSLSATKFRIEVKEVPIAVTSLTRDFLEDTYAEDLEGALRFSAGVTEGVDISAEEGGSFYIRGLRTLRSKRNGVVHLYTQDMTNVARVELVKGPMSVLYGQIEPGGIVNYLTLDALPEFRTDLTLRVGNYDHYRVQLNHTGPIFKGDEDGRGELLYRFDTSYKKDGGWRDNTEDERKFYSGLLQFKPFSKTTVEVQWDFLDQDSFNTAPLPKINRQWRDIWTDLVANTPSEDQPALRLLGNQDPYTGYTVSENAFGFLVTDTSIPRLWDAYADHWPRTANLAPTNAFNDVDHHTSTLEIRQELTEGWFARLYVVHNDIQRESAWGNLWGLGISGDGGPGYSWDHWDRYNDDYAYFLEVTGKWEWGPASGEVITGVEILDEKFDSFLNVGGFANLVNPAIFDDVISDPNNPVFSPAQNPLNAGTLEIPLNPDALRQTVDEEKWAEGYYMSHVVRFFGDRLLVMGGARLDRFEILRFSENSEGERERDSKFTDDAVSPQFGVSWRANDAVNIYASYSESYVPQTGSVGRLKSEADLALELDKDPLDRILTDPVAREPLAGLGYEFGIKYDLFDGLVSGSSAFFRTELDGVSKSFFVEVPGFFQTDGRPQSALIGSQDNGREVTGFETELFIRPTDNTQVILSYAYLDSIEIIATQVSEIRGDQGIPLSIPSASVPEHQVGLWIKHDFSEGMLDGFSLGGGFSWLGERYGEYTLRSGNPAASGFVGDNDSVENRILLDSQLTVDLFFSYEFVTSSVTHTLQLNVSNLFEEEFFLPGGNPNEPRRVYGSWKMSF